MGPFNKFNSELRGEVAAPSEDELADAHIAIAAGAARKAAGETLARSDPNQASAQPR